MIFSLQKEMFTENTYFAQMKIKPIQYAIEISSNFSNLFLYEYTLLDNDLCPQK